MANSSIITTGSIRQQFADTSLPADPTNTIELPGSRHWPDSLREQLTSTLTPAGVLIPIYDRPDTGLSVLLTQRSAELKHHAGQISFPGGRMEPEDGDIAVTALRETEEEVGILSGQRAQNGQKPMLRLKYLSRDTNVKPGQLVVSTGRGKLFPKDVALGTIVSIDRGPINSEALVKPAVDFATVQTVFVLTNPK